MVNVSGLPVVHFVVSGDAPGVVCQVESSSFRPGSWCGWSWCSGRGIMWCCVGVLQSSAGAAALPKGQPGFRQRAAGVSEGSAGLPQGSSRFGQGSSGGGSGGGGRGGVPPAFATTVALPPQSPNVPAMQKNDQPKPSVFSGQILRDGEDK
ncbi:hypothetical protein LIER_38115 [Lithospermum erythrorhizon]|uniref:Uncharacterized protein n=1 Tax=Lithospermum erythrorhizon TaxID=34254 RepID=A0AAV3PZ13_LITER